MYCIFFEFLIVLKSETAILQNEAERIIKMLLQSASGIIKCDNCYKVRSKKIN